MPSSKGGIRSQFDSDDSARREILNRARLCAALTKPWILPLEEQTANEKLPENYQSVGSRGITNLEGKMLLALFSPPWFHLEPAPSVLYDTSLSPEVLQQIKHQLFVRELIGQTMLESADMADDFDSDRMRQSGFRTRKRMAIAQLLVTGDTLEQLTDDYRIKVFRRDQYVTRRDSAMDVLYHIVKETIDPLGLSDEHFAKAELDRDEINDKATKDRMIDLYTMVEWQPRSENWLITQEINGHEVTESEEEVSPFFATPFELVPGEHYGRGFVELNLGDMRSLNELEKSILDFAAAAAKVLPVIDTESIIRPEDLSKPNGEAVLGRVRSGQVDDVAFLQTNKLADFKIVYDSATRKTKDLSAAMLIGSEVVPQKERVTKAQVDSITQELDGALGGVYAPIADNQQSPMLRRLFWQLERDKLLKPLPKGSVKLKVLTGIAALDSQAKGMKLMSVVQAIAAFGPQAMQRINTDVLIDVMMRYQNVWEPGIIKSKEQIAAEMKQAIAAQTAAAAGQKAVDVAGNAAEGVIANQQQGATA